MTRQPCSRSDTLRRNICHWSSNKAAVTADSYQKVWQRYWKPFHLGALENSTELRTVDVTTVLTRHAKNGHFGARTLSHCKWFMSGVYEHAVASRHRSEESHT